MFDRRFDSDTELIVGDVFGVRHFKLSESGELLGVIYPAPLSPGVNEAVCYSSAMAQAVARRSTKDAETFISVAIGGHFAPAGTYAETMVAYSASLGGVAPRLADVPGHIISRCTCGYYAYFNGLHETTFDDQVGAVVRASGRTLIGSLGFRTQRIELVALWSNIPEPSRLQRLTARLYPTYSYFKWQEQVRKERRVKNTWFTWALFIFGLLALVTPFTVSLALSPSWLPTLATQLICYSVFLWSYGFTRRLQVHEIARKKTRGSPNHTAFVRFKRLMNERYPGVPVYRTREAALAAHPTSQPKDFDW